MSKLVIGTHSGHDASACLLVDNKVVCAISKERLTRKKHDSGEPSECVEYILSNFKLEPKDVNLVVRSNWHDSKELNDEYYNQFDNVIVSNQHHLFHAYAASISAGSQPSIALVVDGRGCRPIDNGSRCNANGLFETESVYFIKDGKIFELEKEYRPYTKNQFEWGSYIESVGYAYGIVSKKIFSSTHAAGKVMALASFSDCKYSIPEPFDYGEGGKFSVNKDWLKFMIKTPNKIDWGSRLAKNIAHSVQSSLETYYRHRTHWLAVKYNCSKFTLAGGTALNCKNNGLVANYPWVDGVNLFPACGDDGLCIGAAVWALREYFNDMSPVDYRISQGVTYSTSSPSVSDNARKIAELLASGEIGAMFSGGSEFGPRALGHRSILSAAHSYDLKDKLNTFIKKREPFRPFGAMVLCSNLNKITSNRLANPYMLSAAKIRPEIKKDYPGVVHIDGSVRLQIIEEDGNLMHQILLEFEKLTGQLLIINTSFNGCNEPIVETPQQAQVSATALGLNFLYLDGVLEILDD